MRKSVLVLLTLAITAPAAALADTLTITVTGVRDDKGTVRAAIYDNEASFPKLGEARAAAIVKAAAGEIRLVIENLPPGRYAVAAFHDENDNGKLDRDSLGIPTEGYGFSNDARGSFGPPKFAQAAFQLGGKAQAISLALDY